MFTGAELAGLCREAAIAALREDMQVTSTHSSTMFARLLWVLVATVILGFSFPIIFGRTIASGLTESRRSLQTSSCIHNLTKMLGQHMLPAK